MHPNPILSVLIGRLAPAIAPVLVIPQIIIGQGVDFG
jgi:hypothetical protein